MNIPGRSSSRGCINLEGEKEEKEKINCKLNG